MAQPNQFTKADEQGLPRPQASNQFIKGTRTSQDESTKDRIRAELLSKKYYKFAMASPKRQAKMGISKEQVAAAKMLIDKGKPSLQSVESFESDPLSLMSEEDMVELIRSHIRSHPEVIQALNLIPNPHIELVPTTTEELMPTGTTEQAG